MTRRDQQSTEITLRPIGPEDVEFLVRVYESSRYDLAHVPWNEEQKAAFAKSQFDAQHLHYQKHFPKADFDIVLVDQKPAGRLYIDRAEDEFRVIDIAILPEFQGDGIGTRLMTRIIKEATLLQLPVRLSVRPDNPVREWYTRLGFELVAAEETILRLERPADLSVR